MKKNKLWLNLIAISSTIVIIPSIVVACGSSTNTTNPNISKNYSINSMSQLLDIKNSIITELTNLQQQDIMSSFLNEVTAQNSIYNKIFNANNQESQVLMETILKSYNLLVNQLSSTNIEDVINGLNLLTYSDNSTMPQTASQTWTMQYNNILEGFNNIATILGHYVKGNVTAGGAILPLNENLATQEDVDSIQKLFHISTLTNMQITLGELFSTSSSSTISNWQLINNYINGVGLSPQITKIENNSNFILVKNNVLWILNELNINLSIINNENEVFKNIYIKYESQTQTILTSLLDSYNLMTQIFNTTAIENLINNIKTVDYLNPISKNLLINFGNLNNSTSTIVTFLNIYNQLKNTLSSSDYSSISTLFNITGIVSTLSVLNNLFDNGPSNTWLSYGQLFLNYL